MLIFGRVNPTNGEAYEGWRPSFGHVRISFSLCSCSSFETKLSRPTTGAMNSDDKPPELLLASGNFLGKFSRWKGWLAG